MPWTYYFADWTTVVSFCAAIIVVIGAGVAVHNSAIKAWTEDRASAAKLEETARRADIAGKLLSLASRAQVFGNSNPSFEDRGTYLEQVPAFQAEVESILQPLILPAELAEVIAWGPSTTSFAGSPQVSNARGSMLIMAQKLRALAAAYSD